MKLTINKEETSNAQQVAIRLSMLLWGIPGCGKTTLAATAPGNKLLINYDPDGPASLGIRDDVFVLDQSQYGHKIIEHLKSDKTKLFIGNSYVPLDTILADNPHIDTVIVDSLTAISELCMHHAVSMPEIQKQTPNFAPTFEVPGMTAYGGRLNLMKQIVTNILRVTNYHNKHVILIAHEGAEKDKNGVVTHLTVELGGNLPNDVPRQISEVWSVMDNDKKRMILIRPCRMRKPMKTRMFTTEDTTEFEWKYSPTKRTGMTLSDWYEQWQKANYGKLPLPK